MSLNFKMSLSYKIYIAFIYLYKCVHTTYIEYIYIIEFIMQRLEYRIFYLKIYQNMSTLLKCNATLTLLTLLSRIIMKQVWLSSMVDNK